MSERLTDEELDGLASVATYCQDSGGSTRPTRKWWSDVVKAAAEIRTLMAAIKTGRDFIGLAVAEDAEPDIRAIAACETLDAALKGAAEPAGKLPNGCECDPDDWLNEVTTICDKFVYVEGEDGCLTCSHNPECHPAEAAPPDVS